MNTVQLNQNNLKKIDSPVSAPAYSRDLIPAIVHIGLGHFHRAHQAVYFDTLLTKGLSRAGIFEINLIPDTAPLARITGEQDYLYPLITKSARGEEKVRIIGSVRAYLNASGASRDAIARMASAETNLISLTVTEKGYCYDDGADDLAWDIPGVKRDRENPAAPETTIGYLAAALALRFNTNKQPLTIMSCDNFPTNGRILKTCVLSFCREVYPEMVSWIENEVAFPNSMVDRITPNTTTETINYIKEKYGVIDAWPVCSEDFRQWVLEDSFKTIPQSVLAIRDLEQAGVQIVQDVEPYELMKIRLLNGSHSALSYPAYLMGYTGVAEAIEDPLLQKFIRIYYMEEITATLPPVAGIDLGVYKDTLISRFSNRNIADTILRLASDGSKKIPNAIQKALAQTVKEGLRYEALLFALAGWARFLSGADESGKPIPLEDCNGPAISAAAQKAREDPENFLRVIGVQGISDADLSKLAGSFKLRLEGIYKLGIRGALEELLKKPA
ncbi:MAG: mannitol dehydrogenase family protein [Spirochaetaceae bacterium]|jgi:mannitol-1-phosphate/altronate dehydrogenase|nr:mannitol dehydrogenase family protein [Spirochaetaceae bacterium]